MSFSPWSRKRLAMVALIGASFGGISPVRAQNSQGSQPSLIRTPIQGTNSGGSTSSVGTDLSVTPYDYRALNLYTGNALTTALFEPMNPMDELLGASLRPVEGVLRSQLRIPGRQGLLVASLRADGPSAQAGLQQNDVLMSLADKPLATATDLTNQLKAAGESTVPLKIFRAGKPVTIQVRPSYRVTFAPAAQTQTEYYLGVPLEPVDEALRAQLGLSAGQGVVITEVVKDSPAEKAGVKMHDVALALGDKPIGSREDLVRLVQANRDTPSTLKVLRAGKPITIPITAAIRKVQSAVVQESLNVALIEMMTQQQLQHQLLLDASAKPEPDLAQRVVQLEKELKALREAMDKVNASPKKSKP